MKQVSLLENERLSLAEAVELTLMSLKEYGQRFRHWVVAFSGGKDSTTLIAVLIEAIEQGLLAPPESLTVMMSDTKQEFLPLNQSALGVLDVVQRRGYQTQIVQPPLDKRLYVYMLGRGVPPAGVIKFRWCTRILKSDPMDEAIEAIAQRTGSEVLVLTGVRQGESAARDQRISLSCSKDGGECGQGWFQNASKPGVASTLAPLLHWRLCFVEDYCKLFAPALGFDTRNLVDIYGFDEDEQMNIRTGCAGCMLVEEDRALNRIVSLPQWSYLEPLRRLHSVYDELWKAHSRLKKVGVAEAREVKLVRPALPELSVFWDADGEGKTNLADEAAKVKAAPKLHSREGQWGPLTMEARRWGLAQVKAIQDEINDEARRLDRPEMWLINAEEEARILELIAANTWPDDWDGTEPRADTPVNEVKLVKDGSLVVQPILFG